MTDSASYLRAKAGGSQRIGWQSVDLQERTEEEQFGVVKKILQWVTRIYPRAVFVARQQSQELLEAVTVNGTSMAMVRSGCRQYTRCKVVLPQEVKCGFSLAWLIIFESI